MHLKSILPLEVKIYFSKNYLYGNMAFRMFLTSNIAPAFMLKSLTSAPSLSLSLSLFLFAIGGTPAAFAVDVPDAAAFEAALTYQQGTIALSNGLATLKLPANFRYLDPADTEKVLVQGWGNPPGNKTLGMIVPAGVGVLGEEGWGVVVTYEADGHVADSDADSIRYDQLLKDMQASMEQDNAERKKQGYAPMRLVGWADMPRYDKASHKLYWAKEFKTEGASENSLNYNIRVLGRQGVLVLNAVASMRQISEIRREMRAVTAFSDFAAGHRYADFDGRIDRSADYGLAALVAGGAAAKLGLFGKLFALLLAFKKVILLAVGGLGLWLVKLFRSRNAKVNLDK